MLRWLPRRIQWVLVLSAAAGSAAALLATSRYGGEPEVQAGVAEIRSGSAPVVASTRPHPLSCKPSPPVVAGLVSSGVTGTWHVRLEALAAASQVVVSVGSRSGEQDLAPVVVWRGSLVQGETRDLDVRYAPPAGATEVWVDARIDEPGAVQRSRAALAVRDGRAVPQAVVTPKVDRLVVDPVSGLEVLEVVGTPGGSR